ncbi:hypothetical protein [Nocardia bovistercoris]|uniref:Uncharacterized protein n=1 Tax=Nocardia bovistercoris TaxID=2785916 RepID=A0A931N4F7_9NOCA|nr:hypothetical protein [Nocardia bovistercoris]MBH0778819.1 hypothetical protein [Nocardia bovistercoris]
MTDPLAQFWVHDVIVERFAGTAAFGPLFDAPTVEHCNVAERSQVVRDSSGVEVVTSASVAFPVSLDPIPLESRVTLPTGRVTRVVTASASDLGTPFPDTLVIQLA